MNDDLGENKAHLFCTAATAKPGDVLVDLGVREGVSSMTMLAATAGQQCKVIGVDVSSAPDIHDPRYSFLQTDSITAIHMMPQELFMVFVDTLHIKEQVIAELFHYWPRIRVGGWAVFHDTNWPPDKHDTYMGTVWGQAVEGVDTFFADAGDNIVRVDYPESHGMTFVQKRTPWEPYLPNISGILEASRLLTLHILGR
jgi:cephalosporin hydroxylase